MVHSILLVYFPQSYSRFFFSLPLGLNRISATVKERPADCIRINKVAAALKKMKRHKAPGMSGLVAEMIQATGVLQLCEYWIYVIEL